MGVDLTIMPQSYASADHLVAHDSIMFDRDRGLWEVIEKSGLEVDVTLPVICHYARTDDGDTCYGEITENPYGTAITTMSAKQLADLLSGEGMYGKNVWILAALKAMKPDQPILFYWH